MATPRFQELRSCSQRPQRQPEGGMTARLSLILKASGGNYTLPKAVAAGGRPTL